MNWIFCYFFEILTSLPLISKRFFSYCEVSCSLVASFWMAKSHVFPSSWPLKGQYKRLLVNLTTCFWNIKSTLLSTTTMSCYVVWTHILILKSIQKVFCLGIFSLFYTGRSFQQCFLQWWETSCNSHIMWTRSQFIAISSWVTPTCIYPYAADVDIPCSWIVSVSL